MTDHWFDDAAGPVVRPYAMTRGRTRSSSDGARLDLIALVIADCPEGVEAKPRENWHGAGPGQGGAHASSGLGRIGRHADLLADGSLAPEHIDIVTHCRRAPQSVAEIAAELDLPVGVIRVLIGDLIESDWVRVSRPVPPAELPDESILREVIDGLRAL
jgi:hypothetical protein